MIPTRTILLTGIAATALGACDLSLEALSAPPPGAVAELDAEDHRITLSRGAALAIACTSGSDLCDHMTVSVADPEVADARVAYRNALDPTVWEGPQPATSFIIFGKSAGTTRVHVDSADGDVTYDVRVR